MDSTTVLDADSIRNDTDSKTLTRIVMTHSRDSEFVILMNAIQTACKLITRSVRKAGIAGLYGTAGGENSTGDQQKKLDVLSNEMMVNALYNSHVCCVLVSEENDDAIFVPEHLAGKYAVAFDPLDGSSNIDCNVSTGTIFAVWEKVRNSTFLQQLLLNLRRNLKVLLHLLIFFALARRLFALDIATMAVRLRWF